VLVKNLISLAHHLIVVVAVMIYYRISAGNAVWLIVTVPLFILNFFCLGVIVAIVSARFRDIPPIIMNVLQVGFFITPIIYKPEQLGEHASLLNFNPLNQMLALLREPLLAGSVTENTLLLCILNLLVAGSLAWFLYGFARHRVPYWV
jgi:lipopolysaccharide transport system permease protein